MAHDSTATETTNVTPMTRWAWLSLLVVLVIAALLRAGDGAAGGFFRYDQAEMARMALEMHNGAAFHWLGTPNSAGIPNSPLTIWIYLLPLTLSDSPQFMTLFVAWWNVLGVGLLWFIGYRYFSPWVGFIAGLAFAVNPWAIYYSRAIWEPRTIIPLLLLALAVGFAGFVERKRWAQVLCLPLLLVALQFHYVAFTLLILFVALLWIGRRAISWGALGASILLGVLVMLPFAYGISQQPLSSGDRLETIIEIWRAGPELRTYPLMMWQDLATGFGAIDGIVRGNKSLLMTDIPRLDSLWWLIGGLTLTGLVAVWRPRWRRFGLFMVAWTFTTILVLVPAWTGSGVYHHHLATVIPAFALLAGIGGAGLLAFIGRWFPSYDRSIHMIGTAAFALLFAYQGIWTLEAYDWANTHYTADPKSGQTVTPLHYLMDVREELAQYDDIILLGANPHESNYYIWEPMLYNTAECVRDLLSLDGDVTVLPDGEFAAVVAPLSPINADYTVPDRYTNDDPTVVPLRPDEDPYIIYEFEQAPPWTETPVTDVEAPPFANGVQLTGYHIDGDALYFRWYLNHSEGDSVQYYAHFFNAAGERIGQRDAPFYAPDYWCADDTIITLVLANIPDDAVQMRVGMYRFRENGGTDSIPLQEASVPFITVDLTSDQ